MNDRLDWYDDKIVTKEMIDSKLSMRGGWTKKAIAYLGVPWPPRSGWKARILGLPRTPLPASDGADNLDIISLR